MNKRTPQDVERVGTQAPELLRQLTELFADAFDDPLSYSSAKPSQSYIQDLLRDDKFIAMVCRDNTEVIGGLVAYELRKFEQERSEIYIYDLAVARHCRRRGIATVLITELKELAASKGAHVIFVQADNDDPPAIALYTKLGVREEVLHFDILPAANT